MTTQLHATKPLRIALLMQGDRSWIGGIEYIKNIVLALASLPSEVRPTFEICLICSKSLDPNLYSQVEPYLSRVYYPEEDCLPLGLRDRIDWKIQRSLFKQHQPDFEAFLRRQKIDFIYPYFNQNSGEKPYRSAAWIYDFQHKYLPQFFAQEALQERDQLFALTAHHSSTVVLSSKAAESDFQKFFPEASHKTQVLSFKTSPVSEWYEGDPHQTQQKYSLPDRFFLVSNQFWQHKNHLLVFQALKLLQEKSIYPIIVCTGHIHDSRQPSYSDTVLQTIHQLGVAQQVHLLGLIPKLDQVQLMRRSLALIQPSLFEGWSTLVEDARCFGKRMLLSDLPVNLEQNPPNSLFFERHSPEHLASLMVDWWEHLLPGADLEQEAIARTNSLSAVEAFGQRFLEVARGERA